MFPNSLPQGLTNKQTNKLEANKQEGRKAGRRKGKKRQEGQEEQEEEEEQEEQEEEVVVVETKDVCSNRDHMDRTKSALAFSASNSETASSMSVLSSALILRPFTIVYSPSRQVTGSENIIPAGIP